jgi:group I intron endonuclease
MKITEEITYGISGIYKIQSKIKPKRIYIGSAVDIRKRVILHLYKLKLKNHHNPILQNHFNKYGESDLMFSILLGCPKEELINHEQFFLDSLNPTLNICKIANGHLGRRCSPESIERMKIAKKNSVTPEFRERMREIGKKRGFLRRAPMTEAIKEKIRLKAMGNKRGLGVKRKDRGLNSKLYGTPRTDEVKKKSSIKLKIAWEKRKQKQIKYD